MVARRVLDWLLDPVQPAVRARTFNSLLGKGPDDRELRAARADLYRRGWVADLLAARSPWGGWEEPASLYRPKYLATHWRMIVLADLGVSRDEPAIAELAELWMSRFAMTGGGVGGSSTGAGHHCIVGNLTRSLIQMGYTEDVRVRRSLDWLVATADPKGGWSCFGRGRNLDSWEGLSAFAAFPRDRWTTEMTACVGRGAEFYLDRQLHLQGGAYAPWERFHYPVHYYYDLLVGLDLLTRLGYAGDPRLQPALALLRKKRRTDGRWNLDAQHPDAGGAVARFYAQHPRQRPTPFVLEAEGAPSRMVTLRALEVLARVEAAGGATPESGGRNGG